MLFTNLADWSSSCSFLLLFLPLVLLAHPHLPFLQANPLPLCPFVTSFSDPSFCWLRLLVILFKGTHEHVLNHSWGRVVRLVEVSQCRCTVVKAPDIRPVASGKAKTSALFCYQRVCKTVVLPHQSGKKGLF